MNGRIEKEIEAKAKMEKKLSKLPNIFTAFYNWMDARDKTYTTMNNYINHVVDFMKFYTKGEPDEDFYSNVTDEDIESYMTYIKRKSARGKDTEVGDDIRAARWSSLNTFYKFLMQKKYIKENPMAQTERPKIRTQHNVTYMTQKEIQSVFDRIEMEGRPMTKNRDRCIIALGLGTGLRVSAIVNINVEDIDFKTNTIRVIEKGRKVREISFSNHLRKSLLVWLNDRARFFGGGETGPLFISQKKNRMSVDSVQGVVKKYTSHLDKHITPHKLRSSAAMNLYSAGIGIMTIASVLGHENITTTQRYAEAYDAEVQSATSILDNFIDKGE
nr:MAG TPA: SITE SPECIFIC RECOMBINASE XERD [Caudoviricetes sp.]